MCQSLAALLARVYVRCHSSPCLRISEPLHLWFPPFSGNGHSPETLTRSVRFAGTLCCRRRCALNRPGGTSRRSVGSPLSAGAYSGASSQLRTRIHVDTRSLPLQVSNKEGHEGLLVGMRTPNVCSTFDSFSEAQCASDQGFNVGTSIGSLRAIRYGFR